MGHHHDAGISPVLDIGGEVGALVVYLAVPLPGGELEACPAGEPARRFHTGIHARRVGEGSVHAAVFPSVARGRYDVLGVDGAPLAQVDVSGGKVAELYLG